MTTILLYVAYCKLNCLETGDMGCVSCKEGYITAPECCSCDVGFEETEDGECQRSKLTSRIVKCRFIWRYKCMP